MHKKVCQSSVAKIGARTTRASRSHDGRPTMNLNRIFFFYPLPAPFLHLGPSWVRPTPREPSNLWFRLVLAPSVCLTGMQKRKERYRRGCEKYHGNYNSCLTVHRIQAVASLKSGPVLNPNKGFSLQRIMNLHSN